MEKLSQLFRTAPQSLIYATINIHPNELREIRASRAAGSTVAGAFFGPFRFRGRAARRRRRGVFLSRAMHQTTIFKTVRHAKRDR